MLPRIKSLYKLKHFRYFLYCLLTTLVLSISTLTLNEYFTKSIVLGTSIEKIEKPVSNQVLINYWKNYLSINRKYLPGWTELAKLSKLEGDIFGSRSALYEAKKINPNSPLVIELENSFKTNK